MSNCQQYQTVNNIKLSTMSNCQQCQIVKNVKLSNFQNCQKVKNKLSKCQNFNNVILSNYQIVKFSQYEMSCIIRVCRLT